MLSYGATMNLNTKLIIVIVAAGIIAATVTMVGAPKVNAQATQSQFGTCTGPDKACDTSVTTPSGITNLQGQTHNTGITQQGGGATTFRVCGELPSCTGGVFTPSGNINVHSLNATSTP
jgi:hypothetical protein